MPIRLGRFEQPKHLTKEVEEKNYAKFVAEPFETGYGHTIGNSLRRVLLSSLEGSAITSIKIDGAKGRNDSLYFIFKFSVFCILGERGSPRIDLLPKARGPNSMRPWNHPIAFSSFKA